MGHIMCNHNLAGICPPTDTTLRTDLRVGGPLPYAGVFPPPSDYNWGGNARDSGDIYKIHSNLIYFLFRE